MRDVLITGCATLAPEPGGDLRPARWAHQPARLARMDRLCGLALVAADAALLDAALTPGDAAWAGERVGVVVGTALGCHATNEEYFRGVVDAGGSAKGASPRLFAYTLPSSPLGEVSIHYGARGPAEVVASGAHAGVEALGRAARLCASGRADVVLVVAAEVGGGSLAHLGVEVRDGGAALIVERGDHARARGARVLGAVRGAASAFGDRAVVRASGAARAESSAGVAALAAPPVADAVAAVTAGADARYPMVEHDDASSVVALAALVAWLRTASGQAGVTLVARDSAGGAAALAVSR